MVLTTAVLDGSPPRAALPPLNVTRRRAASADHGSAVTTCGAATRRLRSITGTAYNNGGYAGFASPSFLQAHRRTHGCVVRDVDECRRPTVRNLSRALRSRVDGDGGTSRVRLTGAGEREHGRRNEIDKTRFTFSGVSERSEPTLCVGFLLPGPTASPRTPTA